MTSQTDVIKGNGFLVEVIRTRRRKTASVRIHEGKVSLVVPDNLSESRIHEIMTQKTRWIRSKLLLYRETVPLKPKEYVSGESFTYLGKNYRLKVAIASRPFVKLVNSRLRVALPERSLTPNKVKNVLTDWYRTRAEQKLQEKIERYAKLIGVQPASVRIKTFKSRWGSCSSKGDLLFNWKIIIAPNRIVDYVVVHELCHLKQHNHSPLFWTCVERAMPDYRECRQWLKVNGRGLDV